MSILISTIGKTFISIGIGVVIGLSPLRNSQIAKIIVIITGGSKCGI